MPLTPAKHAVEHDVLSCQRPGFENSRFTIPYKDYPIKPNNARYVLSLQGAIPVSALEWAVALIESDDNYAAVDDVLTRTVGVIRKTGEGFAVCFDDTPTTDSIVLQHLLGEYSTSEFQTRKENDPLVVGVLDRAASNGRVVTVRREGGLEGQRTLSTFSGSENRLSEDAYVKAVFGSSLAVELETALHARRSGCSLDFNVNTPSASNLHGLRDGEVGIGVVSAHRFGLYLSPRASTGTVFGIINPRTFAEYAAAASQKSK